MHVCMYVCLIYVYATSYIYIHTVGGGSSRPPTRPCGTRREVALTWRLDISLRHHHLPIHILYIYIMYIYNIYFIYVIHMCVHLIYIRNSSGMLYEVDPIYIRTCTHLYTIQCIYIHYTVSSVKYTVYYVCIHHSLYIRLHRTPQVALHLPSPLYA